MSKKESLATLGDLANLGELYSKMQTELSEIEKDPEIAKLSSEEKTGIVAERLAPTLTQLARSVLKYEHRHFAPTSLNYWANVGVQALATTTCVVGGAALAVKFLGRNKTDELEVTETSSPSADQGNLFQATERPTSSARSLKSA